MSREAASDARKNSHWNPAASSLMAAAAWAVLRNGFVGGYGSGYDWREPLLCGTLVVK
jgi:hypothetical protein